MKVEEYLTRIFGSTCPLCREPIDHLDSQVNQVTALPCGHVLYHSDGRSDARFNQE